jgi:NAD(P)-dependent dehydrogenase (short-subunit alcohol dehydrogenase family)
MTDVEPGDGRTLAGQVAIVTGGGTGIGLAAARRLARGGAAIVLFGPDGVVLDKAAAQVRAERAEAMSVSGDVSDDASVAHLVETTCARFGRIDILVNSAAIQPYGTVETTGHAEWDRTIAVNLKGVYLTGHHVVPVMRAQRSGAIVNVASVQGSACQKGVAAYAASKGGVLALTRAMALDHADDGIRVNSVSPGSIDTPMLRYEASLFAGKESEQQLLDKWGRMHPLGRVGRAEEVAELIAFLCEPRAAFCTGADFKVDGGLLAKLSAELPE